MTEARRERMPVHVSARALETCKPVKPVKQSTRAAALTVRGCHLSVRHRAGSCRAACTTAEDEQDLLRASRSRRLSCPPPLSAPGARVKKMQTKLHLGNLPFPPPRTLLDVLGSCVLFFCSRVCSCMAAALSPRLGMPKMEALRVPVMQHAQ